MKGFLLAALVAVAVFAGTLGAGFLDYDDPHFILEPEVVRAPSVRNVVETLTHPVWGSYHPLHILSYTADAAIFGMQFPQGFHGTNVALFALSAGLVVLVARSYGVGPRGAALAGVLFAVHPCHVESVAWLTGRKDVLSGFFLLLALLVRERTLPSLGFFLLALAAKTTAFVLGPFLLVDAWLSGKLDRRSLLRLLPFLVLAAVWLAIDGVAQWSLGAVKPMRQGSLLAQLEVVLRSLAWYPIELVHPRLGPHPTLGESNLAAVLVLAAVVAACVLERRLVRPAIFFFLALAPVSNLLPLSNPVQDRYLFVPSIAAACVAGALLARRRALVLVAALAAGALAHETSLYSRAWSSDLLLWTDAVEREPGSPFAHLSLASALHAKDRLPEALEHAQTAVRLGGGEYALYEKARIEEREGDVPAELATLEQAWALPDVTMGTAAFLVRTAARAGAIARAREVASEISRRWPGSKEAHRANAYVAQAERDLARASEEYWAADPLPPEDWLNLAAIEHALGREDRARAALERAHVAR